MMLSDNHDIRQLFHGSNAINQILKFARVNIVSPVYKYPDAL
jgi:hypothetical protein